MSVHASVGEPAEKYFAAITIPSLPLVSKRVYTECRICGDHLDEPAELNWLWHQHKAPCEVQPIDCLHLSHEDWQQTWLHPCF